ncbi:MAG: pore-forming ESAT-6 family protein [Erysipelotrichaceae bacterium]|nr:pore-forming ESAT-6 family protein [Erysipelotrichaceae bacterium]
MEDIRITLPEVSNCAASLRNINAGLDEVLSTINRMMMDLNAVWKGTAGETIVERFQKFSARFIDESETIEEYAKFLDYTVSSYDSLESTITANASNFE